MDEVTTTEPLTQQPSDFDKMAIARSLRITNLDEIHQHEHKINAILEWATTRGARGSREITAELSHLKTRLGNPTIGEISAYIHMEMDRVRAIREIKRLNKTLRKFGK